MNRADCLCELNVIEQVLNVAQTSILRDAWARRQSVTIHGWIYAIDNGLLHDLAISIVDSDQAAQRYNAALHNLAVYRNRA